MTSPSPICTVADGLGSPQATTNGVDVTPGNIIHIALASAAGADVWALSIIGQDDIVSAPTITLDNTTKTATFNAPASACSLIVKSTVTNGGSQGVSFSTTFKVSVLTPEGHRLLCSNERLEGNATFGWITCQNDIIRAIGGFGKTTKLTNGQSRTVTAREEIIFCNPDGGSCSITAKFAPETGSRLTVHTDSHASPVGPVYVAVSGNGHNMEDPASPGTFSSSVLLTNPNSTVVWDWNDADSVWVLG